MSAFLKANFVIHDHPDMPGGFLRLGLFRLVLICLRFPFVVFPPVLPSSETTCGVGLAMNRVLKHLKETGALSSHLPTKWRDIKESRGKLRDFYSDVSTFFENGADPKRRQAMLNCLVLPPTKKRPREVVASSIFSDFFCSSSVVFYISICSVRT